MYAIADETERALAAFARFPNGGLIVTAERTLSSSSTRSFRLRPNTSCRRSTLPAILSPQAV